MTNEVNEKLNKFVKNSISSLDGENTNIMSVGIPQDKFNIICDMLDYVLRHKNNKISIDIIDAEESKITLIRDWMDRELYARFHQKYNLDTTLVAETLQSCLDELKVYTDKKYDSIFLFNIFDKIRYGMQQYDFIETIIARLVEKLNPDGQLHIVMGTEEYGNPIYQITSMLNTYNEVKIHKVAAYDYTFTIGKE